MTQRKMLREGVQKKFVIAPFVYDGVQALFVEKLGFKAAYMTGFGAAATLGMADVGLITLSEMTEKIRVIANTVNIPIIADADTGYGNYMNVIRTVREYEKAGAAALHLEDQVWPKKCGYLANKQVIAKEEAISKIKAAVDTRKDQDLIIIGRTDSLAVGGWGEAEDRVRSYAEAGADMIFVDGIRTLEDIREYNRRLGDLHIVLNNLPLISMQNIKELGNFEFIIHPGAMLSYFRAFEEELNLLKSNGTTSLDKPFDVFNRIIDVLEVKKYYQLDNIYGQSDK